MMRIEINEIEEMIDVCLIDTWPASEMRAAVVREAIDAYVKTFDALPPLELVRDADGKLWLVDGSYRLAAARRLGRSQVRCRVQEGTSLDALRRASRANDAHGVRVTSADKRARVATALLVPEFSAWPIRRIADFCGVGHATVARIRALGRVPLSQKDSGTPPERLGSLADRIEALEASLRADPKLSNSALAKTHALSRSTVAKRRAKLELDPSPCRGGSTDIKPSEEVDDTEPVSGVLGEAPAGDKEDHDSASRPETWPPLPGIAITDTEPIPFSERLEAVHRALRDDASQSTRTLARNYGVSRNVVARARLRLGLDPSTCRGGSATSGLKVGEVEPGVLPTRFGEGLAGDNREDGEPGSGVQSTESPIPTREQRWRTFAEKRDAARDALRADASPSNRAMARKFGVSRDTIRKLRVEVGHGLSACRNGSVPPPSVPSDEPADIARVVGPEVGSDNRLIAEEAFFIMRFKSCPEDLRGLYPAMLRRLADQFDSRLNEPSNRTMDHPDEKGRGIANGFGAMSQRRPPL